MMKITPELVRSVAQNARLKLTSEEVSKYSKDLADILKHFEVLSEADTKSTEPSFHPIRIINVAREDEAGECIAREEALSLAKHRTQTHFKGPKTQ
ncbi:Asp-tRNA(Asn)/Glu-tRNA(Gln) amidotransferase subunit GatC [Candidatus Woesearchaeota archaeon]|nr:MAG: Asp-tRNA(Asn)/Glu-tRNA(Gln) amidotransferase subunit GatC [Candidatus Woesearchaeota archaeon]